MIELNSVAADPCYADLIRVREKYGTSKFDYAVKRLMKRRLEVFNRPGRVRLSDSKRQKLYFRYGGICHICQSWISPTSDWEVDHFDPNLESNKFNAERNLRPVHAQCNRQKGPKSIEQAAFDNHQTVAQYLAAHPHIEDMEP